jgi:hypothetical protein
MTTVAIHNDDLDRMESLIDRLGVPGALDLLAEVASAKADHIRENWQDEKLAASWDHTATRVMHYALKEKSK